MRLWIQVPSEISLDKELYANCLMEICMEIEKLIPAAMVDYGLNRVQLALLLINGFSWYGLC